GDDAAKPRSIPGDHPPERDRVVGEHPTAVGWNSEIWLRVNGNTSAARAVYLVGAGRPPKKRTTVLMSFSETAPRDAQRRFQELLEPHLGSLLRFARRRTASLSDAEDVVQEACLRAWLSF